MFNLRLTWHEDAPPGARESDLYPLVVPALPPEGTVIQLTKTADYGIFGSTTRFFDVEVVEAPILDATDKSNPAMYSVEVMPFN